MPSSSDTNSQTPPLRFFHGSQRWSGRAEVQPVKAGRYECGPGLYLTTCRQRASSYAKGSGSLVYIELSPDTRFLKDARFTRAQMQQCLDTLPRVRHRQKIEQDLDRCALRHPDGQLLASYLVNLCVNHEVLTGAGGPALAKWLTEQGVDASLQSQSGNEDWVVVFNPDVITMARKLTAAQADEMGVWEFGSVRQQRASPSLGVPGVVVAPRPKIR